MFISLELKNDGYSDRIAIKTSYYDEKFVNAIKSLKWEQSHRKWDGSCWLIDLSAADQLAQIFKKLGYVNEANLVLNLFQSKSPDATGDLNENVTIEIERQARIFPIKKLFQTHPELKAWMRSTEIFGIQIPKRKVNEIKRHNSKYADWDGIITPFFQYDWKNNQLFLQKACIKIFVEKLAEIGYAANIINKLNPIYIKSDLKWNFGELRECQKQALNYLKSELTNNFGASFQLPTGVGKTIVILKLIKDLGLTTCILVDTRDLLYQWKSEIERVLGTECGIVGDGIFEPKEITVATVQSVWNYLKTKQQNNNGDEISLSFLDSIIEKGEIEEDEAPIDDSFFQMFSIVDMDEMHIGAADTYLKCLKTFTAMYFIGQSATTWRTDRMEKLTQGILGKVGFVYSRINAEKDGHITPANINIVKGIKICKNRIGSFQTELTQIIHSVERNNKIADIVRNAPKPCLVMTDRINHQSEISNALKLNKIDHEIINGNTNNTKRIKIKQGFSTGKIPVVVSTIWKKGTDIPAIASLVMAYPTKSDVNVIQMIGRALRLFPNKKIAEIYDIADDGNYLSDWFNKRLNAYRNEGWVK